MCVACAMGSWADTWLGRERLGLGWGRASDGRLRVVGLLYVRVDLWGRAGRGPWAPQFVCSLSSREAVHRMIDRGGENGRVERARDERESKSPFVKHLQTHTNAKSSL